MTKSYRLPKESHITAALTAEEVGIQALTELLSYYHKMLNSTLEALRYHHHSDISEEELKKIFEEDLDLVGVADRCKEVVRASSEVIAQILQELKIGKDS